MSIKNYFSNSRPHVGPPDSKFLQLLSVRVLHDILFLTIHVLVTITRKKNKETVATPATFAFTAAWLHSLSAEFFHIHCFFNSRMATQSMQNPADGGVPFPALLRLQAHDTKCRHSDRTSVPAIQRE